MKEQSKNMKPLNLRKIVSLVAFWTLVLLLVSSVAVYLAPKGKIAEQTDWQLFGLGRYEWNALHLNIGLLFILTGVLHLYYNWKRFLSYLKSGAGKMRIFTANFIVATLVTLLVTVGAIQDWPPFGNLTALRSDFKQGRCGMPEQIDSSEEDKPVEREDGVASEKDRQSAGGWQSGHRRGKRQPE